MQRSLMWWQWQNSSSDIIFISEINSALNYCIIHNNNTSKNLNDSKEVRRFWRNLHLAYFSTCVTKGMVFQYIMKPDLQKICKSIRRLSWRIFDPGGRYSPPIIPLQSIHHIRKVNWISKYYKIILMKKIIY